MWSTHFGFNKAFKTFCLNVGIYCVWTNCTFLHAFFFENITVPMLQMDLRRIFGSDIWQSPITFLPINPTPSQDKEMNGF